MTSGLPVAVEPMPKKSSVPPLLTYMVEPIDPSVGMLAGEELFGSYSLQMPLLTLIGPVKELLYVPKVSMPGPFLVMPPLPAMTPRTPVTWLRFVIMMCLVLQSTVIHEGRSKPCG